jgi:hypothetical protein
MAVGLAVASLTGRKLSIIPETEHVVGIRQVHTGSKAQAPLSHMAS